MSPADRSLIDRVSVLLVSLARDRDLSRIDLSARADGRVEITLYTRAGYVDRTNAHTLILTYGQHAPDSDEACLVEAACAYAEPERQRTDAPGWAPALEAYARATNDAYGFRADRRRTVALGWAVEALPRADRSTAAEHRRMWLCLGWALCDAAETLDAARVPHGLWALAIPVDRATARAAYYAARAAAAALAARATVYAALAARATAYAAAYATRATRVARAYVTAATAAASDAARAAAYYDASAASAADAADADAADAAARWAWLDARMPARLRVLCEVAA